MSLVPWGKIPEILRVFKGQGWCIWLIMIWWCLMRIRHQHHQRELFLIVFHQEDWEYTQEIGCEKTGHGTRCQIYYRCVMTRTTEDVRHKSQRFYIWRNPNQYFFMLPPVRGCRLAPKNQRPKPGNLHEVVQRHKVVPWVVSSVGW